MSTNQLYPIFLNLKKLHVLIIGGGEVGLEKLRFMISNSPGAQVALVAPKIKPGIIDIFKSANGVELLERQFNEKDLEGKGIIILATNNNKLNLQIRNMARAKGILVNVADTPELCDFYLGSIVTKGNLKIAISTNGKSPTFSKRIRQFLENSIPDETPQLLRNLNAIRDSLEGNLKEKIQELNSLTEILVRKP